MLRVNIKHFYAIQRQHTMNTPGKVWKRALFGSDQYGRCGYGEGPEKVTSYFGELSRESVRTIAVQYSRDRG